MPGNCIIQIFLNSNYSQLKSNISYTCDNFGEYFVFKFCFKCLIVGLACTTFLLHPPSTLSSSSNILPTSPIPSPSIPSPSIPRAHTYHVLKSTFHIQYDRAHIFNYISAYTVRAARAQRNIQPHYSTLPTANACTNTNANLHIYIIGFKHYSARTRSEIHRRLITINCKCAHKYETSHPHLRLHYSIRSRAHLFYYTSASSFLTARTLTNTETDYDISLTANARTNTTHTSVPTSSAASTTLNYISLSFLTTERARTLLIHSSITQYHLQE